MIGQPPRLLVLMVILFSSTSAQAWSWRDLFQTPEQQARSDLKAERYGALADNPSMPHWQALGNYRQGDFEQAAEHYDGLAAAIETSGVMTEAAREKWASLRYNQATALTQAGRYEEALARYDQVLESAPTHESALHNRAITQQLLDSEQQQQQQSQQQDGESSEDGQGEQQEGSSGNNADQNSSDRSGSESDARSESSASSESESSQPDASGADDAGQPSDDGPDDAQESVGFSEMMAGEEQQNVAVDDASPTDSADSPNVITVGEDVVSEDQQATEQWLRQIEDDPSGLLRRKLQRSHMTDHPNVRDSVTPW